MNRSYMTEEFSAYKCFFLTITRHNRGRIYIQTIDLKTSLKSLKKHLELQLKSFRSTQ